MGNGPGKPVRLRGSVKINLLRPKIGRLKDVSEKNSRGVRTPIASGSIFRERDPSTDLERLDLKTGISDRRVQIDFFATQGERTQRPIELKTSRTIFDRGAELLFGGSSMPLMSFARVIKFFRRLAARFGFFRNEGAMFRDIMQNATDSGNVEERSSTDLLHDANSNPQEFGSAVVRRVQELANLVWNGTIATESDIEAIKIRMPSDTIGALMSARQRELETSAAEADLQLRDLLAFLTKTKFDIQEIWSRLSNNQKTILNSIDVGTSHSIDSTIVGVAELFDLDARTLRESLSEIAREWDEVVESWMGRSTEVEQSLLDDQVVDIPRALLRVTTNESDRVYEHPLLMIDEIIYIGQPVRDVMRYTSLDVSKEARYETFVLLPIGEWLTSPLSNRVSSDKIDLTLFGPRISSRSLSASVNLKALNGNSKEPNAAIIAGANLKYEGLVEKEIGELAEAVALFALYGMFIPLTEIRSRLETNYEWTSENSAKVSRLKSRTLKATPVQHERLGVSGLPSKHKRTLDVMVDQIAKKLFLTPAERVNLKSDINKQLKHFSSQALIKHVEAASKIIGKNYWGGVPPEEERTVRNGLFLLMTILEKSYLVETMVPGGWLFYEERSRPNYEGEIPNVTFGYYDADEQLIPTFSDNRAFLDAIDIQPGHTILAPQAGTGRQLEPLAEAHPNSNFIAMDINPDSLQELTYKAAKLKSGNVKIVPTDITEGVPLSDSSIDRLVINGQRDYYSRFCL